MTILQETAFGRRVFQQTVGIPMGINCAPPLTYFFLYSYEAHFIHGLLKSNENKLAFSFDLTFRNIDDVLSLSNSKYLHMEYISFRTRACRSCMYNYFLDIGLLLTRKLLNQGFLVVKSKSSLRKFYCHDHDLDNRYCEILFDFSFFSVRIPSVPCVSLQCDLNDIKSIPLDFTY
jgi:hypothetical protein